MYESFYGLREKPFLIVPDPSYLYISPTHQDALTYLEYGFMENVGIILLTGEIGTGKTTLVKFLMDQFGSEKDTGVLFNTNVTAEDRPIRVRIRISLFARRLDAAESTVEPNAAN